MDFSSVTNNPRDAIGFTFLFFILASAVAIFHTWYTNRAKETSKDNDRKWKETSKDNDRKWNSRENRLKRNHEKNMAAGRYDQLENTGDELEELEEGRKPATDIHTAKSLPSIPQLQLTPAVPPLHQTQGLLPRHSGASSSSRSRSRKSTVLPSPTSSTASRNEDTGTLANSIAVPGSSSGWNVGAGDEGPDGLGRRISFRSDNDTEAS